MDGSDHAQPDDALGAEIAVLTRHLRELGRDSHAGTRALADYAIALAFLLGGNLVFYFYEGRVSWLVRASAMILAACGSMALSTIGHTASHGALTRSPRLNQLLFYVTYPFLLMLSASYWRHSHVKTHHGAPNVVGIDTDCDLRPAFGINRAHAADVAPWLRRVQGWAILLVLPFNAFNVQRQGWARLLSDLRSGRSRTLGHVLDLAAMLLHVLVFLVVPAIVVSPKLALLAYVLRMMLLGVIMFAVFAPGHYPASAACLHESQRRAGHYWLRQTATTVNFRTGFVGRWLCAGLDHQIEHHLFPNVNHVHLAALGPKVRAICERHGFPYRTIGWGEAIVASWRVFFDPKVVVEQVALLRHHPTAPLAVTQASFAGAGSQSSKQFPSGSIA